jgi:DNA invertase Pin-like site-specific DNA recombinase
MTGRLVGYARVSTGQQDPAMQVAALKAAGVDGRRIYTDVMSGRRDDRPGLRRCLAALQEGDTLVVWKLDRLGRSVQHLVKVVNDLSSRGVGFRSLTESIDTTTNGGRLIFHVFAAIAEFERDLIAERTQEGLKQALANGHKPGRPRALTGEQAALARQMHEDGKPVAQIARVLGVSRPTIYRVTGAGQAA